MDIISTKFINRIFPVIFIMMFASITAQTAHAGSLEPEAVIIYESRKDLQANGAGS